MVKVNSFWIYFYRLSVKAYRLRYKVRIFWELDRGRPQHYTCLPAGRNAAELVAIGCSGAGGCLLTAEARYVIRSVTRSKTLRLGALARKKYKFRVKA